MQFEEWKIWFENVLKCKKNRISTLQHVTSHWEVLLQETALWLCTGFRSGFKFWMKVNWFQIGQEALQWQRVSSKKELHVPTPAYDVRAIVDPWHHGGKTKKNKWIALATHDQSKKYQILKENLSLYRSSKWTQGSQQVAVWNNKRSLFWNFAPVWDCYKAGKGDLTLF